MIRSASIIADGGDPGERCLGLGGAQLVTRNQPGQRLVDPLKRLLRAGNIDIGQQHLDPVLGQSLADSRAHLARPDHRDCSHNSSFANAAMAGR
jgi:hypothetical protein